MHGSWSSIPLNGNRPIAIAPSRVVVPDERERDNGADVAHTDVSPHVTAVNVGHVEVVELVCDEVAASIAYVIGNVDRHEND